MGGCVLNSLPSFSVLKTSFQFLWEVEYYYIWKERANNAQNIYREWNGAREEERKAMQVESDRLLEFSRFFTSDFSSILKCIFVIELRINQMGKDSFIEIIARTIQLIYNSLIVIH